MLFLLGSFFEYHVKVGEAKLKFSYKVLIVKSAMDYKARHGVEILKYYD